MDCLETNGHDLRFDNMMISEALVLQRASGPPPSETAQNPPKETATSLCKDGIQENPSKGHM